MKNTMKYTDTTIRFSYDNEIDAAYITLTDQIEDGEAVDTITVGTEDDRVQSMVNLDFDKDGRLLGIEILDANKVLRGDLLGKIR